MGRFEYNPVGVCSSKMIIDIDNDIILNIKVIGSCPGNTVGISKLCCKKNIDEVIELLKGIDCRGRGTSCPDQLALALIDIKQKKENV